MNLSIELVEIDSGEETTIYSIRFKGNVETELENFFLEFSDSDSNSVENIRARLQLMAHRRGVEDTFFKMVEGDAKDFVCALKGTGNLRLYCIRDPITGIIIGGGGIKVTRSYQEDEKLYRVVKILQQLDKQLYERIDEGNIIRKNKKFEGNLSFEVEL